MLYEKKNTSALYFRYTIELKFILINIPIVNPKNKYAKYNEIDIR